MKFNSLQVFFVSILLVLLVGLSVFAGCSSSPTQPAATSAAPTSAATTTSAAPASSVPTSPAAASGSDQIIFGAVNSLTGVNQMTGSDQKWAFEYAVNNINAAGGLNVGGKKMTVKLVFEDDQSTSDGGASAAEKLIKVDHADVLLSSNNGPINDAAATVAEKYKVFFAGGGGWWGEEFQSDKLQYASDMFFTAAGAAETPFQIWNTQPADQRPSKIAILMEDDADGQGFGGAFVAMAKQYGYNVVDDDSYTPGTKDYSSNILKMKTTGADALLWFGSPPDGITLIQQIKAANLNLKYIHGWKGFWSPEFAQTLGADANYIIHDAFWAASMGYPGNDAIDQAYRKDHNGNDSTSVGMYNAVIQVLAKAIENAGAYNTDAIKNAIWGHTFTGTTMGDITYDASGYCFTPPFALQWWNGQREPVWPQVSTWQLKWVPPWNQR